MNAADEFSLTLLEEAKRFLEKAEADEGGGSAVAAYCHAALVLGYSSLEAHVNALADEFLLRRDLQVLDRSVLSERDYELVKGEWTLGKGLKMYRLEDRVLYIFARFSSQATSSPTTSAWWAGFKEGLDARNRLAHPREPLLLVCADISRYLGAIIECLDALYRAVFRKGHPSYKRRLASLLSF